MPFIIGSSQREARAYRRRVIVATSIGNALEWFDFVAYGFLAVTMAKLFFPNADDVASLLLTFGSFGVPFLVRPFGAVVMGAYADRHGRKSALLLTITLMSIGTAAIAFVPTYGSIGLWAAVAVIAARMLQGLSVGGEFGSALAYLVEQNPRQRGALAGWHYASQSMTAILATGFGIGLHTALTDAEIEAWAWRLPFIFGLLVGPAGYYIRSRLHETSAFTTASPTSRPLRDVVVECWPRLLLCVGLIVVSAITTYFVLFMPTFAIKQLGLPASEAYLGSLLTGIVQVLVIPIVGLLSDRWGRTLMPLGSSLAILLLIHPMFAWMVSVPTLTTVLIVQAILGLLNAITLGCLGGLMSELFPTRVLASGLSIANALAQTLFGGSTPFISLWLIEKTGNPLAPSYYLMFGSAVSILALMAVRRASALRSGS